MRLLPFNKTSFCPKCSHSRSDACVRYCIGIEGPDGCISVTTVGLTPRREHLNVTCARCGYTWHEETADK